MRSNDISDGEPILRGTCITVGWIIECSKAGQTVDDILHSLPHLSEAQIYSALAFYHSHRAEIDRLTESARLENVLVENKTQLRQIADGVTQT